MSHNRLTTERKEVTASQAGGAWLGKRTRAGHTIHDGIAVHVRLWRALTDYGNLASMQVKVTAALTSSMAAVTLTCTLAMASLTACVMAAKGSGLPMAPPTNQQLAHHLG